MNLRALLFFLPILINTSICFGQLNSVTIGDAVNQGNNCYIITPDIMFQTGGVWYNNPINFSDDFTIYYQGNFGTKDFNGADGTAIVFKRDPQPELGNSGGGMGYQGIISSLIVEFDTWQNTGLSDPVFDHISIMRNGNIDHADPIFNLAGPVQASPTSVNIEDGNTHEVKIEWIASQQLFEVYFDCIIRVQLSLDIKNSIFAGDDSVFFGFVGSTGGSSNLHQVCLNRVSFVDNLQLQDQTICDQVPTEIDATIASGVSYSWSPIEGISNPNIPNPIFSPDETTTYTVTIADVCGDVVTEEVTVNVAISEAPIFDEVDPICFGDDLALLPETSNNNISGFWSPPLNNTVTTTYTFTPISTSCSQQVTLEIIVNPLIIPSFDSREPICEGDVITPLPIISNNNILGSWSPELNNTTTTTYTFTPNPGQGCVDNATMEIIVNVLEEPLFDFETTICEGTGFNLPNTSTNGVTGNWSPSFDNMVSGTYTFTPNQEECATEKTIQIEVATTITPEFNSIEAICEGEEQSALPTVSNNGISGTWSPELNNTVTTVYTFTPLDNECASTTTIEIEVIPNIVPLFNYPITSICPGEALEELPLVSTNNISGTWSPELNNLETTTYTFTPNSNQNCVLETTLEILVSEPILPGFDTINPICEGEHLDMLPLISNNGITGSWTPELNNTETTTYTFTPNPGQCSINVNLEIEVLSISALTLDISYSEPFSDDQTVTINVFGGTGNYEYQLDSGLWQTSNVFSGLSGCKDYMVSAREVSGCSNIASENFQILDYPKFFTPNGDTYNETWNIDCLRSQNAAKITIFDRFGKVLTTIFPSRLGWDGTYNNSVVPSNDYWFKVEYIGTDGFKKFYTSHFSLKR